MFAYGFSWFHLIGPIGHDTLLAGIGVHEETYVFAHACLICAILVGLAVLARIGLERARAREGLTRYFAEDRLSARTIFEFLIEGVGSIMNDIMEKKDVRTFLPFIAALFLYLFACNIIGIFPGFLPPTDVTSTSAGIALIVFVLFNFVGLTRDPVGYIKHMIGPVWLVAPLLFPIEVISLLIRPVTLTLRITGNLFGDHTVFTVMSDIFAPLLPVPFIGLAMFVSFMQAFVFSLLSAIYLAMAIPHHEAEEH